MTTYKQGDIILVWFLDSNLMTAKKRPAVVLQSNNLQTGLGQLIIGMITSVKSTSKCQIMKGIGHNSKIKLFQ
ncbi:MAG: type II toxin-antitoxin system PemK/MazF family toxin [ANME-2 cluster archaeon]|nr:type II toxin-antitoxin system PemK/MazF family toxin [ANME-2 cluster archaeon]